MLVEDYRTYGGWLSSGGDKQKHNCPRTAFGHSFALVAPVRFHPLKPLVSGLGAIQPQTSTPLSIHSLTHPYELTDLYEPIHPYKPTYHNKAPPPLPFVHRMNNLKAISQLCSIPTLSSFCWQNFVFQTLRFERVHTSCCPNLGLCPNPPTQAPFSSHSFPQPHPRLIWSFHPLPHSLLPSFHPSIIHSSPRSTPSHPPLSAHSS